MRQSKQTFTQPNPNTSQISGDLQETASKVVQSIKKNGQNQLFYKAFLKPIEIALKTYDTQSKNTTSGGKIRQYGCLPFGLKQVIRQNISQNKSVLVDFQSIDVNQNKISGVKDKKRDNLISLMKPKQDTTGIKVAICICMYSQDKSMLKRTLAGVSENILMFNQNGIPHDKIAVVVVMDGIQPVQQTVEQLFEEIQKDSNMYLNDDVEATNPRQLLQDVRQKQDQQVDNLNHLIFSQQQLEDLKRRRFKQRRRQYKMYKKMIVDIQKLEKQKVLTFQSLDSLQQQFFFDKARQLWKNQYAYSEDEIKLVKQQDLYEKYATNLNTARPIIKEALNQAKKFCKEYISTRDNFALLNTFRVQIKTPCNNKNKQPTQNGQKYQDFNQQQNLRCSAKMNLFFITKYKNRGKLSSHNWFFNGFCQQVKPQYTVLLDVGLVPEKQALWRMVNYMQHKKTIGGVCGYMGLRIQKLDDGQQVKDENVDCITSLSNRLFDIQRAQQFQYHFAHLIDKPFQSSFKFIHVLPGAFSAYRFIALKPRKNQDSQLLKQYFKSIDQTVAAFNYKAQQFTIFQTICKVALPDFVYTCVYGKPNQRSYQQLLYNENVYLAEDRTLCMGIHQYKYDLAYLPDAYAWVDPIKTLYGLLGQRKRWINGSFFAFDKVKQTLDKNTGDCLLKIQILYLTLMNCMSFIAPALFMYTIHIALYTFQTNVIVYILERMNLITTTQNITQNSVIGLFVYLIDFIYVLIFLGLVFFSMNLTNRYVKFQTFFYGVSTTYGVFSLAVFGVLLYEIISGFTNKQNEFLVTNTWLVENITGGIAVINSLRYIMIGIMGLYIIPVVIAIIYGQCRVIIDILFSTLSFIFYSPTYLNILNIYALCRMDDISWGTKGLNAESTGRNKEMTQEWKKIKLMHVSKFVLYNLVVGFLLILFGDNYVIRFWFTFGIMVLLGFTLAIKVLIGSIYLLIYRCCGSISRRQKQIKVENNDTIQNYFSTIKQSIYTEIKQSISQIKNQIKEQIPTKMLISNSKIYTALKKNNKIQNKQKQNKNVMSNQFSRIRNQQNSKIYKNMTNNRENSPMVIMVQPQQITPDKRFNQTNSNLQTSSYQLNISPSKVNSKKRINRAGL